MKVLAIDPGPKESALVIWDGKGILAKGKQPNETVLSSVKELGNSAADALIVEQIKSYGMSVSDSIFDTVYWSGRFVQAWADTSCKFFDRVPRMAVKMHLCGQAKAKDANIRQALIDRFEPGLNSKERPKGILKGVTKDEWAALALAVYWNDCYA